MKRIHSTLLIALTAFCGSAPTSLAQINDLGYGDAPGTMTRDLLLGPEWRVYQNLTQPTHGELARPQAVQPQPPVPAPMPAPPNPAPMLKQTDYALKFFGGDSARQTLQQMPRRPQSTTHTRSFVPVGRQVRKPFQNVSNGSTISPYLNLDRPETPEELPNYFTFVRPQFEQRNVNRQQQRELQKLERQVQAASYNASASAGAGIRGTGHSTRFGDTGRYYSGWRR